MWAYDKLMNSIYIYTIACWFAGFSVSLLQRAGSNSVNPPSDISISSKLIVGVADGDESISWSGSFNSAGHQ
jgi:hypothetical protein